MLEIAHTAVGAAIGFKIPNPLISFPLAFASHFVLDLVPHWNPHLLTETKKHGRPTPQSTRAVVFDVLGSLAIGFFVASQTWPNLIHFNSVILACSGAILPDLVEAPYFFFEFRPAFLKRIVEFQNKLQGRAKLIPGLVIQFLTIILAFFVAFG